MRPPRSSGLRSARVATTSAYERAPRAEQARRRRRRPPASGRRIACLSRAPANPYLRLLYEHLAAHGFELVDDVELSIRWLWRERRSVGYLHFHWPDGQARYERGPALGAPGALVGEAARLRAAARRRARCSGTAWSGRSTSSIRTSAISARRERLAARSLGRACHVLLAHDAATAELARRELGRLAARVSVVPHASYIGVYPPGRGRGEVRAAARHPGRRLRLPLLRRAALLQGHRPPAGGVRLVRAALGGARLIVAGHPKDAAVRAAVEAAAAGGRARSRRCSSSFRKSGVRELFEAADAAVVARSDGGTSGSLVLACSLGVPVVAADSPAYAELTLGGRAGWLFRERRRRLAPRRARGGGFRPGAAPSRAGAPRTPPPSGSGWPDVSRRRRHGRSTSGGGRRVPG